MLLTCEKQNKVSKKKTQNLSKSEEASSRPFPEDSSSTGSHAEVINGQTI